jgi:glycosyltransferase involved in cell wall biosynthesis
MKPFVSVLVDTYNHERYIEQAILSVIEQGVPSTDYEIVVVDDGSTDRTPEIVRKFEPRVRLLRKKNGGQASAYNLGIHESRGETVAFLDGDDWFAPGKLQVTIDALEANQTVAAIGHGYYEFSELTRESVVRIAPCRRILNLKDEVSAREACLAAPFLHNGSLTVRRRVLESIVPIPEALVFCADAPIAFASMCFGLLLIDQPLLHYRLHESNLHGGVSESRDARMRRKCEMTSIMFEVLYSQLRRLQVPPEAISAALDDGWILNNRLALRTFGGSPITTFRTEMRDFHRNYKNRALGHRLLKYLCTGAATLALPPGQFYRLRDWYAAKNVARLWVRTDRETNSLR